MVFKKKFQAISYRTGKKLSGRFSTLNSVFRKFPKERKAFNRVMAFNRRTGRRITNVRQIRRR